MSCPKCEPQARSKRRLWWLSAVLLLIGAAYYLDRSSPARPSPGAPGAHEIRSRS
jgi:hypothetical protein